VDVRLRGGWLSNHGLGCWIFDEVEGVSETKKLSLYAAETSEGGWRLEELLPPGPRKRTLARRRKKMCVEGR